MKKSKKEAEGVLEVRGWKQEVSEEIGKYGWDGFHRKAAKMGKKFDKRIKELRRSKPSKTK